MTRPGRVPRPRTATVTLVLAIAAGLACGKPTVTNTPGSAGGSGPGPSPGRAGSGGAGSGSGAGGSGFALPDAGADVASGPAGGAPGIGEQCAESSKQAEQVPVDLLLVVDSSGSMSDESGTSTKWAVATEALSAFVKDPRSSGLGVGLSFFPKLPPEKSCTTSAECPRVGALVEACHQKHLCGKAGTALAAAAAACDAGDLCDDPAETCLPVGTCSMSGGECLGVGGPCAGGQAGNTCTARSKVCRQASNGWCMQSYDQAAVGIAPLPANEPPLSRALGSQRPQGGTPLGPALAGAFTQLARHQTANPGRKVAIILVSDGLPDGFCGRNFADMIIQDVAAARTGRNIPTYVIGVFAADDIPQARPVMERLATAGGTGMPFILMTANDLGQRFQEALNQIRGTALACEFTIPTGTGAIDFGRVNVRWQGAGGQEDLLYVASAARCDPMRGGWYFDVDPATGGTPQRVLICPASCNKFKADAAARVELRFGCKTRTID